MSVVYSNSNSEFYKTYLLYREYIGYEKELSYSRWLRLPDRFKAAALYVQFYDQITLAWYKCKTEWSIEEEGVETINQYLMKNVKKIEEDSKRFRPAYIYKVAWNCLYCLCIDPTKNKDRYYNETPESFATNSDDEVSWFDFVGTIEDFDDLQRAQELSDFFDSLDEELQCYLAYVLGELTEVQIVRKLKHLGLIDGNTKDREYRKKVLDELNATAPVKLQAKIEIML
jgi:hypothetical protein